MNASNAMLAFFQNLGAPELIVIGIIALLLFGKRLPEVGRSLGKGIVEFKKGLRDTSDDVKQSLPRESDILNRNSSSNEISPDDKFNKP